MQDPAATRSQMLGRAWRRRCPRCAATDIMAGYAELEERCPGCGHKFEREPGYWVGAMIVITTMTFGVFVVFLVSGIAVTWPEVPWTALLATTLLLNLVVPIWLYGRAKLVWAALELGWNPLEPHEVESAAAYIADR